MSENHVIRNKTMIFQDKKGGEMQLSCENRTFFLICN